MSEKDTEEEEERLPYTEQDLLLMKLLDEEFGDEPLPPPKPLPKRWRKLLSAVNTGNVNYRTDPSKWSRHKIGEFDAVICCGEGGYGLVFEVFDPKLQRRCALKLCEVGEHQDPEDVLTEARMLASLSHPNIVAVYETGWYGENPKDPYFVMEYATGKTAHHFALDHDDDEAPPPWQEIVDIYLGAGKGLAFAHGKGVVHGDFKPSNVLIDEGGARPRVADFGFSRHRLEHTPEHERDAVRVRAGTLAYAAPEALRGEACDALSDQWSFCASLWHSLEGTLPFDAESTDRMIETIERTELRFIESTVPKPLRAVLERGLSIDPGDRFSCMDDLLHALDRVRQTAVTSPLERLRKGPGWGPFVITVLVASASVVTAVSQQLSDGPTARGKGVSLLEPDPRLASASACAVTRAEKDHSVPAVAEGVCRTIRLGDVDGAAGMWRGKYDERLLKAGGTPDQALALDSLIVARTFVSEAETLLLDGRHDDATKAAKQALKWNTDAASTLGNEHAGVRWVLLRQKLVRALIQAQH